MISEFAVRRPQFTLVVFFALAALGLSALFSIPKAEDPTFPIPTFAVVAVLPGSSPKDMERLVVDPIETKLKALDDVKSIKTEIEDSLAVVQIEFAAGVEASKKHDEVLREMQSARPQLPSELARLDVKQFNAANVNIREVALLSETASVRELDTLARSLKRRLEAAPGVGEVEIVGLPKQEVRITLDLPRMVALGIAPAEIFRAVTDEGTNIPAGGLDAGARRFNVKTSGDFAQVSDIEGTIIRAVPGARVLLGDVARVELTAAESTHFARYDGKRAVLVTAAQKEGQNIFTVDQALGAELLAFEATLPRTVTLARGFGQVENVSHRLSGFGRDFVIAILLVLLTLLPLGFRASFVVMVSIPLSLAMGVLFLKLTGFSINQLSIVGFVIALGLLVDDSVVVVENISRHLREGLTPRRAAIVATKQITASVLGCTATLIFAFLPLLALPGTAGQFIRSLPVAVVATIGASLLVSLTVVPFLSSVLLVPEKEHGNIFLRGLTWLIEGSYRRLLAQAVARPKLTLAVAGALFLGSLALVPQIGFSLFPKAGTPQFLVQIEAPDGASLAETDRAARFVEGVLARHKEISRVAVTVGRGHPRIYYNVSPKNDRDNVADVFAQATLPKGADVAFYQGLRAELAAYVGARIELKEFENGPPLEAPIALRLLGDDESALELAAGRVADVLRKTPGTRDVLDPSHARRTDLRVVTDQHRAALLGVRPADVDRSVRLAVGGLVVSKFRETQADEAYDVRVTLPRRPQDPFDHAGLDVLASVYVPASGGAVPLSQVAHVTLDPSPTKLRHRDKERSVTVTSQVLPGYNTERVTNAAVAELRKVELPRGVRMVVAGEVENRQESFGGLGMAILVSAFGVLAILVLEFRTFRSTIIVASVIPLGIIGGMLALFLSGNTLSFTASIGFIALMGIEVKNSILLVDYANELRRSGLGVDLAIQKAGETRFVPILLTTMTAIGGLIPLVLERSSLYSPLALVILGGLVSSTFLTRLVTPVLYKLLAPEVLPIAQEEPRRPTKRAPVPGELGSVGV